jgi:hypothetical protein
VSGINGGKLMCETRREFRQTRVNYSKSSDSAEEQTEEIKPPRSSRPPRAEGAPRPRGSGPREGSEWTMVKDGRARKPAQDKPVAGGRGRPPRSSAPKQDS